MHLVHNLIFMNFGCCLDISSMCFVVPAPVPSCGGTSPSFQARPRRIFSQKGSCSWVSLSFLSRWRLKSKRWTTTADFSSCRPAIPEGQRFSCRFDATTIRLCYHLTESALTKLGEFSDHLLGRAEALLGLVAAECRTSQNNCLTFGPILRWRLLSGSYIGRFFHFKMSNVYLCRFVNVSWKFLKVHTHIVSRTF